MTPYVTIAICDLDWLSSHSLEWQELARHALEPNVFHEPAFMQAVLKHMPEHAPSLILRAECEGILTGLLFLRHQHGLWQTLVHPYAPLGTPLLHHHYAQASWNAFVKVLPAYLPQASTLLMPELTQDGEFLRCLAGYPYIIHHQETRAIYEPLNPQLPSKHCLKNLSRLSHRLADQGSIVIEAMQTPQALEDYLLLEASGWKGPTGTQTAMLCASGPLAFVRDALSGTRHQIYALKLNNRPIAMAILLMSQNHAYLWKIAYDEQYAAFSPGAQLMHAINSHPELPKEIILIDSCAISTHFMANRLWPARLYLTDILINLRPGIRNWLTFWGIHLVRKAYRLLRSWLKSIIRK